MEKQSHQEYVSLYHDDNTGKDFVRVIALGYDFLIPLHDEFDGNNATYRQAIKLPLPDIKKARIIEFFIEEINKLMKQVGGDPMIGWYWTFLPTAKAKPLFYSSSGDLIYGDRGIMSNVRLAYDSKQYLYKKTHQKSSLNKNYDFFLCDVKVREMWLLEKGEKGEG